MNIKHEQGQGKGIFFIEEKGSRIAKMSYYLDSETTMVIDHTIVDTEFQGQHLGNRLVEHGVEFARSNNFKILPKCKFAAAIFQKEKQLQDVLE